MLEVRNLTVAYGRIEALRGVSLAVPEGQIISVIGSNGAGKSTLLKAISGLLPPKSGGIYLDARTLPAAAHLTDQRAPAVR